MRDLIINPSVLIAGISVGGLFLTGILVVLSLSESRPWARNLLSGVRAVVVWCTGGTVLVLFTLAYVPRFNTCKSERDTTGTKCFSMQGDNSTAYEFYHNSFSDLLTVFSVFSVLLGIIVPVGAYLMQRNSLSDEAEIMRRDMECHKDDVSKRQDELEKRIESAKSEVENIKGIFNREHGELILAAQNVVESARSNLACLSVIYQMPNMPSDYQRKVAVSYLAQFISLLEWTSSVPRHGAEDCDVSRFRDFMTIIRRDHGLYQEVVKMISCQFEDETEFLPGLLISFSRQSYKTLVKELGSILPRFFVDGTDDT